MGSEQTIASQLHDLLFDGSPYDGFDPSAFPLDVSGWLMDADVLDQLVDQIKPRLIIEVGSWKGASAHHMLRRALKWGECSIVCIDTWLGSPEHYVNRQLRAQMPLKHGRPQLYEQFIANVIHAGFENRVMPIPLPSLLAAELLEKIGAKAPFIYIDAAHDQKSVEDDIAAYWPLLTPGGVICGDDYNPKCWPGVVKAVDGFLRRNKKHFASHGTVATKWFAQKNA